MILEKIINNPIKRITKKVAKLFTGVALATATFFGNTESNFQQPSLEQRVESEKYTLLRELGTQPKEIGEGPFPPKRYAYGHLDRDDIDNVYVLKSRSVEGSPATRSVEKFDKYGNPIKSWMAGTMPSGIAINNSFVYVSELNTKYILKFDLDGNFIKEWDVGSYGVGDLDTDSLGNVYIDVVESITSPTGSLFLDFVKKFNSEGNFLKEWGTGEEADSKGVGREIAIDKNDNIYVPGYTLDKTVIKKFNSDGEFVTDFDSVNEPFRQFFPLVIDFDKQDSMYVCDTGNLCVKKFDSNGNFITRFSETDSGNPHGVCVDSSGLVYVSYSKPFGHIKKFVKSPVVDTERENDTVTMDFESPYSFTHRISKSSDLQNWEEIEVLKSSDYQNWINARKFYSSGKTWIRDPESPSTTTFYNVSVQEPDFRVVDGVEYCLETNKLSYKRGEQVEMVYRVTNHKEEPFHFDGLVIFITAKDRDYFRTSTRADSFTLAHGDSKEISRDPWLIRDYTEIGRYSLTAGIQNHLTGNIDNPITTTVDVVE